MASLPPNPLAPVGNGIPSDPLPMSFGPPDLTKINPYIYIPSFSMAVIGSIAFLLTFFFHSVQLFRSKSWYFMLIQHGTMIIAGSMIARAHSLVTLAQTGATGPFIIFTLLDMAGGTIVSLGNIFTYTRLIWFVTPEEKRTFQNLWSPPKWTSFMWGLMLSCSDITKAVAQNALPRTSPLSLRIQMVANIVQFFTLACFAVFVHRFMTMSRRWVISGLAQECNWRKLGWTVFAGSILVTIRQAFVIVQLDARADPQGYYAQHEWVYYAFQPLPLFAAFVLYNVNHPGSFLPREYIGFMLKYKTIQDLKQDEPWPLNISPPIPMENQFVQVDGKDYQVRLLELETGRAFK